MNKLYKNVAQLPLSVRNIVSEYDGEYQSAKEAAAVEKEGGKTKSLFDAYTIALVNARINDNDELTDSLNDRATAARERLVTRLARRLETRAGGAPAKKPAAPAAMPNMDSDDPSPEELAALEAWLEGGGDTAQPAEQGPAKQHVTTAEGIVERFADAVPSVKGRRR